MSVGSQIGQYRILGTIGVGGMGTVYLGEHILLGRRAAIKTLLPALTMQSMVVERFFTEARATSAIADHGVVQIFDFGYHTDGTAYIVMELLEGESLQSRIDRVGRIAPSDALRIARQVAGSLAAAHEFGIVHRDLKPDNIHLIADAEAQSGERTKILDFGICKAGIARGEPALTESGTTMGTPVYMSPEQCRGAGSVDHRSDIYALGCVLFHMLAGRPPFECEGAGEFIVAHLQDAPPAPSRFVPELPVLIDGLILRCLAKSPADRYQSMTELQGALEYVLARISGAHPAIPPPLPRPATRTQNLRSPSAVPAQGSLPETGSAAVWFVDPDDVLSEELVDDPVVRKRWKNPAGLAIVLFGLFVATGATVVASMGSGTTRTPSGIRTATAATATATGSDPTSPTSGSRTAPGSDPTSTTGSDPTSPTSGSRTAAVAPEIAPVVSHEVATVCIVKKAEPKAATKAVKKARKNIAKAPEAKKKRPSPFAWKQAPPKPPRNTARLTGRPEDPYGTSRSRYRR